MKNLDWGKINNDRDFQRLVNDLFALEINHPSFLSSNPDIGADGGWDGRHSGSYLGLDGFWSFQSKWTKNNLGVAYKQLQKLVKEELEKAKKNNVKYLLIATNADLKIGIDDHVGNLEKLNGNKKFVDQLFIWPRANLESRIIQYPLLKHLYFGDPQEPMFVPPHIFAECEPLLSDELLGRDVSFKRLFEQLDGKESTAFLVHSGGGYGKTHFIVEAAKRYITANSDLRVVFCRPTIRDVNEAINELDHSKDVLIFLDDAERYPDEARKLIAHTKTFSPGKLRVVFSCRTSGKEIIKNIAATLRIDNLSIFELPQLPENDLVEVLKKSSTPKTINNPERIVRSLNGNLFLIVTTGKLIKGGETKSEQVKQQIKENLDHDATLALSEILSDQDTKKLLRELSIVVPFSRDRHSGIIEKLVDILRIDTDKLNEAIDKLEEVKILRKIGSSVRFNPDMKGDIYLSVEIDSNNGTNLTNQIFENWLDVSPKQLTANIAAASRHRETDSASGAIKDLINKWVAEAKQTSDSLKSKRLELINPIVFLAPEETINLVYSFLNSSSDSKNIYSPSRDTYGPVIYHLLHVPGFEEQILSLISNINDRDLKGTYDNYKSFTLLKQSVSPIEVHIDSAIKSLSVLINWVTSTDCTESRAKLASEGAREALAGSHEYKESYGNQMTFGRKILLYDEQFRKAVDKLRDEGMKLLEKIIFHPNDKIKTIGINIVSDIGHEASATSGPFWERILSDKEQGVSWISDLITSTKSNEVRSAAEDVLVRYWTNNHIYKKLSEKAADILREFPRSEEYIIFRYFVAHDLVITDFAGIEKGAPTDERWSWLVHNHFRLRDFNQKDLDSVVERLSKKYKNGEEVIAYLKGLEQEIRGISQWQYIPIIETWAKFNSEIFISILSEESLLSDVPSIFHLGIYRVASDKDQKHIADYAKKILGNLEHPEHQSVLNLMDLIARHNLTTDEFMPWLTKILRKSNGHLKNLILHRSYFIFKDREQQEKNRIVDVLNLALSGEVDLLVLDMADFLLHHAVNWNLPEVDVAGVRSRLFDILKDIPSIDYHTDSLMRFTLRSDLSKLLNLIEYRLKKQRASFGKEAGVRFDAIPYDGFRSMEEFVKTYADFSQLMDKVNYWLKEELLYSFEVDHLLKNVRGQDEEHGNYLLHYAEEKIKTGNQEEIKIAANALLGVPFGKETADLFLNLLLSAEKADALEDAKEVYAHQVLSGSYTSTVGQAPPALVHKKEALEAIHKKCPPGEIRSYINSLIKSIEQSIKDHLDDDEELELPKF